MEESFDPNIPDTFNGEFFCKLCLAPANSDQMWASHIAGRRHIKNVMKYRNGLHFNQNDDEDDAFKKPPKYGRYENDEWNDSPPRKYEHEYYTRRDYKPEIRPKVIDYGHKKSLCEEISPSASKIFDDVTPKEKLKDPIDKIFEDENFDVLKKTFEEEISKKHAGGKQQNKWKSNSNLKRSKEETSYDDDFEKELDELLKNSPDDSESKDKPAFCNDKFKKNINDILVGKSIKRESEDKDIEIIKITDGRKDIGHKSSNKTKISDHGTSVKKDDKDKMKFDKDSKRKKSRKNDDDDEDVVDIFHKMNDERLFKMSAADEPEDNSSVKKSSKSVNSKLDSFDPDKLTPDLVDNLLSSYLKPKVDSSKTKESVESHEENSAEKDIKVDDPDVIAGKLESLPTTTFFQIILMRLKKLDLKDSSELEMLLEVIAQAQEVVCKKLPPHLQAVIKSKMSQNHSKTTPVSVQNPILPPTNSAPTTRSTVPQIVSQSTSPVVPPFPQTVSQSSLNSGPRSVSQAEVKTVSQPVSLVAPQSRRTPVSDPTPQTKPSSSNTLDSFQSMIAWQNYLSSTASASTKHTLNPANSVQATIAYQNYLSSLQAKAETASKMPSKITSKTPSENLASLNNLLKYKTTLSSSTSCAQTFSQTVSSSASRKSSIGASNSVQTKDALQNLLPMVQAVISKTKSQSSTKSSLPGALNSSQNQSSLQNSQYMPQSDIQTASRTPEIPSNPASNLNQAALQAYYQQMYAMYQQRMSSPPVDARSLQIAAQLDFRNKYGNIAQPNVNLPPYSQFRKTK